MDAIKTKADATSRKSEGTPEKQKLTSAQEWDYFMGSVVEKCIVGKAGWKTVRYMKDPVVNTQFFPKIRVNNTCNQAAKVLRAYRMAANKAIQKQIESIEFDLKKVEVELSEQSKKELYNFFIHSKIRELNHKQALLFAELRGLRVSAKQLKEVSPSILDEQINASPKN